MELIIKLNCMLVRGLAGTISESNKLSLWVSTESQQIYQPVCGDCASMNTLLWLPLNYDI